MTKLETLVTDFRNTIDVAKAEDCFQGDISFQRFPNGCCGDTAHLLAQYLLDNGIHTWYANGYHNRRERTDGVNWPGFQSHAWLSSDDPIKTTHYQIIDITGDQFSNDPEYFGLTYQCILVQWINFTSYSM